MRAVLVGKPGLAAFVVVFILAHLLMAVHAQQQHWLSPLVFGYYDHYYGMAVSLVYMLSVHATALSLWPSMNLFFRLSLSHTHFYYAVSLSTVLALSLSDMPSGSLYFSLSLALSNMRSLSLSLSL
ncbi:unnamed protein product [Arctogadus glacialis]